MSEPGANGGGKKIVVTVLRANHLPKKDMMGKCDPFVKFEMDGKDVGKTSVKKNTYDAEWGEDVEFPWSAKADSVLLKVLDHDGLTGNDDVGSCVLDSALIFAERGAHEEITVGLNDSKGKPTVGKDKKATEVVLRISVVEEAASSVEAATPTQETAAAAAAGGAAPPVESQSALTANLGFSEKEEAWVANERRRLVVTVVSASHLPKMDMLMGKCDPFAVVRMGGKEYKTGTKKGTYDPEWNERVELGWSKSGPEAGSLLRVVLYDEDLTGKDEIGEASLDACLLYRLRVGEEKEVVLGVVDGKGAGVVGKDKLGSEVKLKVKLERSVLGLVALSESQEAWVPNERRRIVATVLRARHLKKMDLMGKVDPYVMFESGGEEYRTGTKKGTYDPEWNERVELGWCESARQVEELGSVVMRVMDADLTSKDEHIGEARLDAGVVHLRKVGEESEVTVEIVDSEGRGVVGEDGEVGEVTLLIGIERSFGAALVAPAEEEAWVANERRRLVVTVVSASHLPKMDMLMGKCDPFAVVRMGGKEYKTGTKKGTYDPEWNERVELGWSKSGPEAGSLLRVVLYDEDLTGKDEIGEASLDACLLYRLRVGEEKEVVLGVVDNKGGSVVGHDKLGSEVKLKVKLERSVLGLVALSESQEAWVPNERRRIVATLVNARSLPKMDLMGLCDPFVVFQVDGKEVQSGVRKNTLSPDWNERLELPWVTSAEGVEDLGDINVRVMDWDAGTASDIVGDAKLSGGIIFQRKIGAVSDVTVELNKDGKPVFGKDGKVSEVRFKLTIEREEMPSGAGDVEPQDSDGKGRRLVMIGASARHLPKMDLLGLCDPFLQVTFGEGDLVKTGVKKNSLNPDWNERLPLSWVPSATHAITPIHIRVMDWDTGSKNDEVGEAAISQEAVMAFLAKRPGQALPPVRLQVTKDGVPVTGKDGKPSEVRLTLLLEGCEEWASAAEEDTGFAEPDEKRFPEGGGRLLGHAVDQSARHSNWTKPHAIVVNSDKQKEARLRALAGAEARRVAGGGDLAQERARQALLSKAAEARASALRGAKKQPVTQAVGLAPAFDDAPARQTAAGAAAAAASGDAVDDARVGNLSNIFDVARGVVSDSFIGAGPDALGDDYRPYPEVNAWHHGGDLSADIGRTDDGCELLARARALLSVAGGLTAPLPPTSSINRGSSNNEAGLKAATEVGYSRWGAGPSGMDGRFGSGDPHVEDHSDNDLAALERIRETIRGLSSGPTKAPQMLDVARAASPTPHEAPQHVRREDSFSSQGWNDGTFRDDVEKSAARHQPLKGDEMMPFGGEGSTVTLPSVAPSASGDSIFAAAPPGGHGARGPSGASGDMRVCVSDLRAKGLGPAGQGVTFCLKLQLNGFKARTAQAEQGGSQLRWYDRCEFELEEGTYDERTLPGISAKLVKSRTGKSIGSASVDSIIGTCTLRVKRLDGMARRAHWQWYSLVDSSGNKSGVQVYAGVEALIGVSDGPMIDLPPSLLAAPSMTAPRPPAPPPPHGFGIAPMGALTRVKEAGTDAASEKELEAIPEVRGAITLQCAWRARNARARLKRAEAWRAYGFGNGKGLGGGGVGRMGREEIWKGGERKEGAASLYSRRRKSPPKLPPPAATAGIAPEQRTFDLYVGQPGHPAVASSKGKAGGARRALALSNMVVPPPGDVMQSNNNTGLQPRMGREQEDLGWGYRGDGQLGAAGHDRWNAFRGNNARMRQFGGSGDVQEAARGVGEGMAVKAPVGFADMYPIESRGQSLRAAPRAGEGVDGERADKIRSAALRLLG